MNDSKIVWSSDDGDLRKKQATSNNEDFIESELTILIRRLTSKKGRTIIELTGLPKNKKWCQQLVKELKKTIGVGGAYKDSYIEIHGEKINQVISCLESKGIIYKKIGG